MSSSTPAGSPDWIKETDADGNVIKSFYTVLGVAQNADEADIKKAHKRLVLLVHPDREKINKDKPGPKPTVTFVEVEQAKEVLLDAETRAKYDAWLFLKKPESKSRSRRHTTKAKASATASGPLDERGSFMVHPSQEQCGECEIKKVQAKGRGWCPFCGNDATIVFCTCNHKGGKFYITCVEGGRIPTEHRPARCICDGSAKTSSEYEVTDPSVLDKLDQPILISVRRKAGLDKPPIPMPPDPFENPGSRPHSRRSQPERFSTYSHYTSRPEDHYPKFTRSNTDIPPRTRTRRSSMYDDNPFSPTRSFRQRDPPHSPRTPRYSHFQSAGAGSMPYEHYATGAFPPETGFAGAGVPPSTPRGPRPNSGCYWNPKLGEWVQEATPNSTYTHGSAYTAGAGYSGFNPGPSYPSFGSMGGAGAEYASTNSARAGSPYTSEYATSGSRRWTDKENDRLRKQRDRAEKEMAREKERREEAEEWAREEEARRLKAQKKKREAERREEEARLKAELEAARRKVAEEAKLRAEAEVLRAQRHAPPPREYEEDRGRRARRASTAAYDAFPSPGFRSSSARPEERFQRRSSLAQAFEERPRTSTRDSRPPVSFRDPLGAKMRPRSSSASGVRPDFCDIRSSSKSRQPEYWPGYTSRPSVYYSQPAPAFVESPTSSAESFEYYRTTTTSSTPLRKYSPRHDYSSDSDGSLDRPSRSRRTGLRDEYSSPSDAFASRSRFRDEDKPRRDYGASKPLRRTSGRIFD